MTEEDKAAIVVEGRVKWFDPGKGFGFIISDVAEGDILLHANVLRNYGQSSIADGAEITVRIPRTQPVNANAIQQWRQIKADLNTEFLQLSRSSQPIVSRRKPR